VGNPIVVCGAGAAGLVAAIFAARCGRRVVLVERTADGGRKILISGGGRCNVLPAELDERRFVTDSSSNALRRILRSWPLAEQRNFFERDLRIPLKVEAESGKLFPVSDRARDIRDALVTHARAAGVEMRFSTCLEDAEPTSSGEWRLRCSGGDSIDATALIVATGGLSVPNTGSDGSGLQLAERLGHVLHPPYPALTPLTQEPPEFADLAGISREVTLSAMTAQGKVAARGGFLFTHRGFSGPAVLDISHVAVRALQAGRRQEILVQWTDFDEAAWDLALREPRGTVGTVVRRHLADRLAEALIAATGLAPEQRLAELPRQQRRLLVDVLTRWSLPWTGHEGYKKAEVTGGGVALGEVDPRTLASRRCQGLYLCGEVLDAFGPIGGYNFAWAWATGRAAGLGAAHAAVRE